MPRVGKLQGIHPHWILAYATALGTHNYTRADLPSIGMYFTSHSRTQCMLLGSRATYARVIIGIYAYIRLYNQTTPWGPHPKFVQDRNTIGPQATVFGVRVPRVYDSDEFEFARVFRLHLLRAIRENQNDTRTCAMHAHASEWYGIPLYRTLMHIRHTARKGFQNSDGIPSNTPKCNIR